MACHLATLTSRCPPRLWDTPAARWFLLEVWGHPATTSAGGRDALGGGGGTDTCASQQRDRGGGGETWGLRAGCPPSQWNRAQTLLGNVARAQALKGLVAEPGGPHRSPLVTMLDLWSLCAVGTCRCVGNRRGRALALGPRAAGDRAETLPFCTPTGPGGHRVARSFPASPRTGWQSRVSPGRSFVAEAPEKPERFTVEMLTGVLVGAHKIAPLSFSILAATARAAPCKSETTFSWGDGICCHWRKKSLC